MIEPIEALGGEQSCERTLQQVHDMLLDRCAGTGATCAISWRSWYVTQSLGDLGRFLILAFVLLLFHVLSLPTLAVVITLAVLCIPAEVFRPKD
jgi:hypothetical protein